MKRLIMPLHIAVAFAFFNGPARAVDVDARIEAAPRVNLSTAVSGVISEIPAITGQPVKAGDVLLRLDNRVFRARVESARADVVYREAMFKEAMEEQRRLAELNERKMLSEHELTMGDIAVSDAKHRLAATQAALTQAEYELTYCEIRAPFDGAIVARHVEIGQFVQVNAQVMPLIEFGAASRIAARAVVASAQAAHLTAGMPVVVNVGGKNFSGSVSARYAGPRPDTTTLTVLFDPKDAKPAPGTRATLQLP